MSTSILSQAAEWAYAKPTNTLAETGTEDENLRLSEREHEIMYWVGHGKTNYEIGMILGISQFTVKNHLQRIFRKIDVRNRAQAITRILAMEKTAALQ